MEFCFFSLPFKKEPCVSVICDPENLQLASAKTRGFLQYNSNKMVTLSWLHDLTSAQFWNLISGSPHTDIPSGSSHHFYSYFSGQNPSSWPNLGLCDALYGSIYLGSFNVRDFSYLIFPLMKMRSLKSTEKLNSQFVYASPLIWSHLHFFQRVN